VIPPRRKRPASAPPQSGIVARARRKFLRAFPGGFRDETYLDWERDYKWRAHLRWQENLSKATFRRLIDRRQFDVVAKLASSIESRTNLLFSFEKMALPMRCAPQRARLRGLPVSGTMTHVQYEWDNGKAAENLRKHGVDFADAIAALEDANRLEEIDTRFTYGEERIQVIGSARDGVLFVVVTPRGEDSCRIISARRATRHEQDRYYAGDGEAW
jgi:uncharacterized protein